MRLVLCRDPAKVGRADEWKATVEGMRAGIGKTRADAMGSLLAANMEAFGLTSRLDVDPGSPSGGEVLWESQPIHSRG